MSVATEVKPRQWHLDPRILYGSSRLFVLVLLCLVLTLASPVFLTGTNALNVLRVASLMVILGIGETIVILTAGIDLSIGSVLTISSVIAAMALKAGVPLPVALVSGVAVGAALGFLNGLMVAVVKLPPFIATYGMMWVASGFAVVLLKGQVIYGFNEDFRFLGVGTLMGIPMPIIIMVVLWIPTYLLMRRTTFGRSLYAVGANQEAARLSGVKKDQTLILAYTSSGVLAAAAGLVYVARLNASEAGIGVNMLLPTIAAVVIGGTSLFGGEGGIVGTMIGALIMTIVQNGMNLLGIESVWQGVVLGALIVIAVLLDQWARKALAGESR
jgi:ribose transport system permease protein